MFKTNDLKITTIFLIITCFFVTCLLISNIIAGKIIQLFTLPLPAAVILFPLTYLFGDILTEVYGYKLTRLVIWIGFFMNILMSFIFIITIMLPYPEFWKNQAAYSTILGLTPRLVIASLIAYWLGEFINSIVLSKVKIITKGRWLWLRTISSTMTGQAIDTISFIMIAFLGVIPSSILVQMMFAQYLWKVSYEIILTPLTYLIVNWLKRKEGLDTFDQGINYNPFKLEVADES